MKKLIGPLILCLFTVSCASSVIKPARYTHKSNLKQTFAQYRNILNDHDWEIRQIDSSGGFLMAVKPETTLITVTGLYKVNVSCTELKGTNCRIKFQRCKNTVPMSSCASVSSSSEFEEVLKKMKQVR